MGVISVAPTFKDLQDSFLEYGYGEVDRTRAKNWINDKYFQLCALRRWHWLEDEAAVATVASTATTALTTSVMSVARLRPTAATGGFDPEYVEFHESWAYGPTHHTSSAEGKPKKFSLFENAIHWFPVPDAVYNYTLYYWARPTAMSGDNDYCLVPPEHRNILVKGALIEAARRDQSSQKYDWATMEYEDHLQQMKMQDTLRQKSGSRRVVTRNHYYGRPFRR